MNIYNFFNDYSAYEADIALEEMTASERRNLEKIFEEDGINYSKFKEDRNKISTSLIIKFTNVMEKNRKNGLLSINQLTLKIMDLVSLGKTNRDICEELNIDYKRLYFELKKVRNFNRDYKRRYFCDGTIIGEEQENSNHSKSNTLNIGNSSIVRFLIISDLHYCNVLENKEAVDRAFNYAKGRGINIILACGDFIDGSFSHGKQIVERYFKQFEYFALNYPYDREITTFGVGGNHDLSAKLRDGLDFIKFCRMYRDDVVIAGYANSFLYVGNERIQMYHEIKGFRRIPSNAKIVLNGHRHRYTINYMNQGNYLNIYVPTLSNMVQMIPEALEMEVIIENKTIVGAHVKEICFGNRDIILSENDYSFLNNNRGEQVRESPKIKELEKSSSQIDKFNKRYGL